MAKNPMKQTGKLKVNMGNMPKTPKAPKQGGGQ